MGGDSFVVNRSQAYKDAAVGPYHLQPADAARKARQEPTMAFVSELLDWVASERCQARMARYEHEIGHELPVSYRPTLLASPAATEDPSLLTATQKAKRQQQQDAAAGKSDGVRPASPVPPSGGEGGNNKEGGGGAFKRGLGAGGPEGPEAGEVVVFNQGVKVLHELHHIRTWYSSVNLRVFASYPPPPPRPPEPEPTDPVERQMRRQSLSNTQPLPVPREPPDPRTRRLRFVVYRVTSSAYSQVTISGFDELREVVGTARQVSQSTSKPASQPAHGQDSHDG